MTLKFSVKVPQIWLRTNISGDINITVEVDVKTGESWDMYIRYMIFPGWHAFNINSFNQNDLYALIEQMAMNKYAQAQEHRFDEYECYD